MINYKIIKSQTAVARIEKHRKPLITDNKL